MGMSTGDSRSINVTPLIDVLLVLLIIFLVMMPIMVRIHVVDIPPRDPGKVSEAAPIVIKLDADLSVSIDQGPVFPNHELAAQVRKQLHRDQAVFVDFVDG